MKSFYQLVEMAIPQQFESFWCLRLGITVIRRLQQTGLQTGLLDQSARAFYDSTS